MKMNLNPSMELMWDLDVDLDRREREACTGASWFLHSSTDWLGSGDWCERIVLGSGASGWSDGTTRWWRWV